ncbi:hypothetical protein E6P78_04555 [Streptomyces sp. A0958]|nr:hypothetical protein E6P78_04555 [Streptomyces sp. A0958]
MGRHERLGQGRTQGHDRRGDGGHLWRGRAAGRLQREAIDEYIAAAEAEHGPVDSAEASGKAERIRADHAAHRGKSAPADAT